MKNDITHREVWVESKRGWGFNTVSHNLPKYRNFKLTTAILTSL